VYYTIFNTKLCEIIVVGNELGISHLHLSTNEGKRQFKISVDWQRNDSFFIEAQQQITAYIAGELTIFALQLNLQGTVFQQKVWQELRKIPFGELCSYQEIARAIGNERAARAVGMANSKNPIPLIIPCHRVIGSNGKLTGFASGLNIKQKLIQLEQNYLSKG